MKEGQSLWNREQLILAVNLYAKIPFGKMHSTNPEVVELAAIIGRSPSAVARKLGNFASMDPKLKERGIKGLENASKLDNAVWNEYMQDWDGQFIAAEELLAQKKRIPFEKLYNIDLNNLPEQAQGKEKERLVRVRINQSLFRRIVLSNFNNKCCITGIDITELLVASHILPWSVDSNNRLNPKNGLSLNTLHDKAFDKGLITITEDLKIKVSPLFMKSKNIISVKQNFIDYDGKELIKPKKFLPNVDFLKAHNDNTFRA